MAEYKGYKYEALPGGHWTLTFPGGGSLKTPKQTESELKAGIDEHEKED